MMHNVKQMRQVINCTGCQMNMIYCHHHIVQQRCSVLVAYLAAWQRRVSLYVAIFVAMPCQIIFILFQAGQVMKFLFIIFLKTSQAKSA